MYFVSPMLYRMIDPTAGAYDAGYLHAINLGLVRAFTASAVAWVMLWMSFPTFYRYLDDNVEHNLLFDGSVEEFRKGLIALFIYLTYFVMLVMSFSPD